MLQVFTQKAVSHYQQVIVIICADQRHFPVGSLCVVDMCVIRLNVLPVTCVFSGQPRRAHLCLTQVDAQ